MPTRQIFLMDGRTRIFDANLEAYFASVLEGAGVADHVYKPDEAGITTASELIGPLEAAVESFGDVRQPDKKHVKGWLEKYLKACRDSCTKENPEGATVSVTVIPDPPKPTETKQPHKGK